MAQDYKNRIPAYRQQKKQRAVRSWGIAGAAVAGVAVLVALATYFLSRPEGEPAAPSAEAVAVPSPQGGEPAAAKPSRSGKKPAAKGPASPAEAPAIPPPRPEPRFSFYKILPEKEIIVAESEIKATKREETKDDKKPAALYMLQAGSFTNPSDADRLKARLAEIKVKAKLEMIKLDNTTWYRVKIGPYASLSDADKVRQHLRANKIDSIVQKAAR